MKNDANNIVIAFEDMLKVKCNVDISVDMDDKHTHFTIDHENKISSTIKKKSVDVCLVCQNELEGFAVYINDKIRYFIMIYEPHGAKINTDLNAIITYGHEQIITLNLANGVFDETYTR